MRTVLRAATLALIVAWPVAHAETLLMDQVKLEQKSPVKRPPRGLTMTQVQKRFGPPVTKEPAVGNPPITRWVYPQYIVYFDHQYVIHSVLRHH